MLPRLTYSNTHRTSHQESRLRFLIFLGDLVSVLVSCRALVGGACSDGSHCGALALNLNNPLSNANWNIGASNSYKIGAITKDTIFLHRRALKYV